MSSFPACEHAHYLPHRAVIRDARSADFPAIVALNAESDRVLSQVKLIAEPWDVGPGGYQVGNFPVLWSEWNGVYRDTMRDFWRTHASVGEFASRLAGSKAGCLRTGENSGSTG